jgi:ABC-2 type transport system permease protein
MPGLVLFFVHSSLAGWQWMIDNFWLANSTFLSLWMWVVLISLLALAISAWVRWKLIAGAALVLIFFVGAGLAQAINSAIDTNKGNWLHFGYNASRLWLDLFDRGERMDAISSEEAALSLLLMSALCVWLLWKKIRACEVVRG